MNIYQLKDMCISCHNNFTDNYCVNCNAPCCVYCCESFIHYNSTYIHICFTCFNNINSKIVKYNDKLHDKYFQNKYNQKLKKITLKKLNLKMLLNSQKTI
jgi:hypothetical protein